MIGYLRGRVLDQTEEGLLLDVAGVGYDLHCSSNTIESSFGTGIVELWVHTVLREDSLSLFGFATKMEKEMFLSLIKVNGVGPKMAIKILSGASLERLAAMIEASDVKSLTNLPKVGKKTAEQMILALKGKLVIADESANAGAGGERGKNLFKKSAPLFSGVRHDVMSALLNLGFRAQDIEQAVSQMPAEIEFQKGVRQGLQLLTGQIPAQSTQMSLVAETSVDL